MSDSNKAYPYETRMDVLCGGLEVIDVPRIVAGVTHPWFNQTLCRVNESVVRLGVVKGEYHWHKHEDLDEFFWVVSGTFIIDLDREGGRSVELRPGMGFVVPKG
jgi:mannose-6-phosphate isomerase-like protein (cupin superfamily)